MKNANPFWCKVFSNWIQNHNKPEKWVTGKLLIKNLESHTALLLNLKEFKKVGLHFEKNRRKYKAYSEL